MRILSNFLRIAGRTLVGLSYLVALVLALQDRVVGRDYFVDNRSGDDALDGLVIQPVGGDAGPVRSIARALERVQAGDTIHLAPGEPYYETLSLAGPRFGGLTLIPFTIQGHGAILSGARSLAPEVWEYDGNLWSVRPHRKAYYQLLLKDVPLPEVRVTDPKVRPDLKPGEWCGWKGTIYYNAKPGFAEEPRSLPMAFAYAEVGITLLDVRNVLIKDLTIRHYRLDGVNAHDRAREIILENVQMLENGRAGCAAGGTSLIGLKDCVVQGNREVQLINAEKAQTELLNTKLGPGGELFRVRGGHLLIDGEEAK